MMFQHFLNQGQWGALQGALIMTLILAPLLALVLFFFLRLVPARWANTRYAAALLVQFSILTIGVFTFAGLNVLRGMPALHEEAAVNPYHWEPTPESWYQDFDAKTKEQREQFLHPEVSRVEYYLRNLGSSLEVDRLEWARPISWLWFLGALLMLWRKGRAVVAAESLRRACEPVTDAGVLRQFEEIAATLRIRIGVQLLAGDVDGPSVVGVTAPAVLIPLAMLSQTPPDQLRLIFAHELAHVRRHDYLVNLFQMAVESLLFFNPAVYWVGARVREEREACCDAMAVAVTGRAHAYAKTLADAAEARKHVGMPAEAVLALGGPKDCSLVSRVKRVLTPNMRPELSFNKWVFATWLGWGGLLLGAYVLFAQVLVTQVTHWYMPDEVVSQLIAADTRLPRQRRIAVDREPVTFEIQLETETGEAVPEKARLANFSTADRVIAHDTILKIDRLANDRFRVTSPAMKRPFLAQAQGYAISMFTLDLTQPMDQPVKIQLKKGFPLKLRFVNEQGEALTKVRYEAMYQFPIGSSTLGFGPYDAPDGGRMTSDEAGMGVIPNCNELAVQVSASSEGYQETVMTFSAPEPGAVHEMVLPAATAAGGKVVLAESGLPAVGARLEILGFHAPGVISDGGSGNEQLVTDASGRFEFRSLKTNFQYVVGVNLDGQRMAVFSLGSGDDRIIQLPEPQVYRGTIKGDLDLLKSENDQYQLELDSTVLLRADDMLSFHFFPIVRTVPVRDEDGLGYFEFSLGINQPICLARPKDTRLDGGVLTAPAEQESGFEVEIRRHKYEFPRLKPAETVTRRVAVQLTPAHGGPTPRGLLDYVVKGSHGWTGSTYQAELTNGLAYLDAVVGETVTLKASSLYGYAFETKSFTVPAGETPLEVAVPVTAAGALTGRLSGYSMRTNLVVRNLDGKEVQRRFVYPGTDGEVDFVLSPLPLNQTYWLEILSGANLRIEGPYHLNETHPLRELAFQFVQGRTIRGMVRDDMMAPIADAKITLGVPNSARNFLAEIRVVYSNPNGEFVFTDVNPALSRRLTVRGSLMVEGKEQPLWDRTILDFSQQDTAYHHVELFLYDTDKAFSDSTTWEILPKLQGWYRRDKATARNRLRTEALKATVHATTEGPWRYRHAPNGTQIQDAMCQVKPYHTAQKWRDMMLVWASGNQSLGDHRPGLDMADQFQAGLAKGTHFEIDVLALTAAMLWQENPTKALVYYKRMVTHPMFLKPPQAYERVLHLGYLYDYAQLLERRDLEKAMPLYLTYFRQYRDYGLRAWDRGLEDKWALFLARAEPMDMIPSDHDSLESMVMAKPERFVDHSDFTYWAAERDFDYETYLFQKSVAPILERNRMTYHERNKQTWQEAIF